MNRKNILTIIITAVVTLCITIGSFELLAINGKIAFFPSGETQAMSKLNKIQAIMDSYCIYKQPHGKMYDAMYNGYVNALNDPYSEYFSKKEVQGFKEYVNSTYAGIGVYIVPDKKYNAILIVSPIKDGPAYNAGAKAGDLIEKVNGVRVGYNDIDKARKMMKGKVGRKVTLTLYRPSEKKTIEKEVVAAEVATPTVGGKVIDGNIGYLIISQFAENTADEFKDTLNNLKKKGIKGLIIDVRDNPGGYYDAVASIADQLLPKCLIVYSRDKYGVKSDPQYSDEENKFNKPIAVLVNGNSASASEILSGAIKDNKKGVLIGTKTYGKGVVQTTFDLKDGSLLKVTIARYYTPSGVCIQGKGIQPNIKVELPNKRQSPVELLKGEKDTQLDKAIEYMKSKIK